MAISKLPNDFQYIKDMYDDDYFPNQLVNKVRFEIQQVVHFIEQGNHSIEEIQQKFDVMTMAINNLAEEFENQGSELETGARESIGLTVIQIIEHFKLDLDVEEAIREREW